MNMWMVMLGALAALCSMGKGESLSVSPGEAIQPALDKVAGSGGTVLLGAGIHPITQALQMASGITLAGHGPGTVLMCDPSVLGQAIGTSTDDLHDVTIRDLTLVGPGDPAKMTTPPEGYEGPGPMGIFVNSPTGAFRDLRLLRLRITRFESMGVHLKGVDGLLIEGCDFDRTAAFNGLYHNVYLRRVKHARIVGCLSRNNPVGNGLQVSFSEDVTITGNYCIGNAGHGIRVAETRRAVIEGNRVRDNRGGAGIWLNTEKSVGCRQFTLKGNHVTGNANAGIAVQNTSDSLVEGNIVLDNGVDFLLRNAFRVTLRGNRYRTWEEQKENRVTMQGNEVLP